MSNPRKMLRGAYAPLFGITAFAFIAFGALSVDLSLLRLADAEIQGVADQAAHAAILQLRRTTDTVASEATANEVISRNFVAGRPVSTSSVDFGVFDNGVFVPSNGTPNAVRVAVEADVDLPFASFWGAGTQTVTTQATAAVRTLHTIVVMDITNSWGSDFLNARAGAVAIFDSLTAAATDADRIGMATFHGMYGTEFTPLTLVSDAVANGVRAQWAAMHTASQPGNPNAATNGCSGGTQNNFVTPTLGGCYPNMPREYSDEGGTDHVIGIQMARTMFSEFPDPNAYRAMIIVTDGSPAGVEAHLIRATTGYEETRWRYEFTGFRRTPAETTALTPILTQSAWDLAEVNTWMVSYRAAGGWMNASAMGDGYFVRTTNSSDLIQIFEDIAEGLPVTLVE